ncbi:MAG: hypothetical protein HZC01_01275 [Candidatus Kerfeldbacteria bacterium]|nr:hypothetical protein [Candidatus Kerfeldbacteria bacterium]
MNEEELSPSVNKPNLGETRLRWDFPEYVQYRRGMWWYVMALIIIIGLLIYSIVAKNYIFMVLIVLTGFIIYFRDRREPAELSIQIKERGIQLGDRNAYRWADLKAFWIIYEPPEVKNLYLDFKGLRPTMSISLEDQNPIEVRNLLAGHLIEDTERENESFSDGFGRIFKI